MTVGKGITKIIPAKENAGVSTCELISRLTRYCVPHDMSLYILIMEFKCSTLRIFTQVQFIISFIIIIKQISRLAA